MTLHRKLHRASLASALLAAAALTACGGGGGGDATDSKVLSVRIEGVTTSGQYATIAGAASSTSYLLSAMTWTYTKEAASLPDLTVSNADCAEGQKTNQTTGELSRSEWSCGLRVTAPDVMPASNSYTFTLTATDEKGNVRATSRQYTFSAGNPAPGGAPLVATTDSAVTVVSGTDAALSCYATGGYVAGGEGYSYRWVVRSNPSALPLAVSTADDGTASFRVPAVSSTGSVLLECQATDSNLAIATSQTVVSISASGNGLLVADAGGSTTVNAGAVARLSGAVSGATGATYYQWTQTGGPAVTLQGANTLAPSFVAPSVTSLSALTFELVARAVPNDFANAGASERSTATVYVQPATEPAPIVLTGSTAKTAAPGTATSVTVSVAPTGGTYYYQWTQVSGTTVTLAGATTATASFITPALSGTASNNELRFVVQVSRKPLASSAPADVVSTDAIVQVQ